MITRCVIIDDEQFAIEVILSHLTKFPSFEVIETFKRPIEAFKFLNENEVDLVISDIAMPQISGLELIQRYTGSARFILATSFSEYAIQSFELNVIDYLLKPISAERFAKSIEKYEQAALVNNNKVESTFIKEGDDFVRLNIGEIIYIEGMGDYAKIFNSTGYNLILKTLKSLEQIFEKHGFLRVHKSFIVPTSKIDKYKNGKLLIDRHEIPVGPAYREVVKNFLSKNQL